VLRGIENDMYNIYSRIGDNFECIDFPPPPESLFNKLYDYFDRIIAALNDEAREKGS
jgi:hypothetical protein